MQNKEDMTTTTMYLTDHIIEEVQRKIRLNRGEKDRYSRIRTTRPWWYAEGGGGPAFGGSSISSSWLAMSSSLSLPGGRDGEALSSPMLLLGTRLNPHTFFLDVLWEYIFPVFPPLYVCDLDSDERQEVVGWHFSRTTTVPPPPAFFLTPPPKFTLLLISLRCTPSKNSLKRSACDDIR